MGNLLAATSFRFYTPKLPAGGVEVPGYPLTNLRLLLHPTRTWRSTAATGAQAIILVLGSVDMPKGFLLLDANFSLVSIALSSNMAFTSDVNPRFTAVSIPKLNVVDRRRAWLNDPANNLSKQYIRITALGTPDGGVGYYELGAVAVLTDMIDLGIGAGALKWQRLRAFGQPAFSDGGTDIRPHGRTHIEVTIEREEWLRNEQDALWDLYDAGLARPIALFENGNSVGRWYLGRRVGGVDYSGQLNDATLPLVLREPA